MKATPLQNAVTAYTIQVQDRLLQVPQVNIGVAKEIDSDKDQFLSQGELENYLTGGGEKPEPEVMADQTNEFSCAVAAVPNPFAKGYHDFNSLIAEFDQLANENPNYVKKEVLGHTFEGREIVGYKFSEGAQGDTAGKMGLVLTGCHHAREWMTVEAPLKLAHSLLDNVATDEVKQNRLKNSEIWIVPCVNPDGFEYSRDVDNMWRKNRRVQETDQLGNPTEAVGVDLNRNYGEDTLNHHIIFRPDGDSVGETKDDFGATSDDPFSEVYRGKFAASEPEVAAMQTLQMRPNIRGVVDFHSYGNDLLYPWSHTPEKPAEDAFYQALGNKVAGVAGYKLESGIGLYPNSGSSDIFQQANGLRTFTFEMGRSFQPNPEKIPQVAGTAALAATTFIDEMQAAFAAGQLGSRESIVMPVAQVPASTSAFEVSAPQVRSDSNAADRFFTPH